MGFIEELERRRTFGIISHPDAGKTTLTEKLLLFGGAIQEAGAVKNNKIKKGATSDFMALERQRGISVYTSVLEFIYKEKKNYSQQEKKQEHFHRPWKLKSQLSNRMYMYLTSGNETIPCKWNSTLPL